MTELILNDVIIEKVTSEAVNLVKNCLGDHLVKIILYGSCARGDYQADSDIDIALILKCDREEAQKYNGDLAYIATELAMKYFAIVNFVCLPYTEFQEKKSGMHILKILKWRGVYCMDKEYYDVLAKVRMERAEELLAEAIELLNKGAYKSANNRAFYAIEKSVKALLALKQIDVMTHNGVIKQFNFL